MSIVQPMTAAAAAHAAPSLRGLPLAAGAASCALGVALAAAQQETSLHNLLDMQTLGRLNVPSKSGPANAAEAV